MINDLLLNSENGPRSGFLSIWRTFLGLTYVRRWLVKEAPTSNTFNKRPVAVSKSKDAEAVSWNIAQVRKRMNRCISTSLDPSRNKFRRPKSSVKIS
jgi:hypothetical protein